MANYDIESIWPNVPSEEWDFYKEYEDFDYVGGEDFWDNPAFKDLGLRKSEFKELELLPDFRKVGKFDSRKEITKEMKRLQDLPSSDDMDFSGWDALQKKLKDVPILGKIFEKYQPKTLYDMQKKYAMSRLANSLQEESLIPDDTYTGAQGRFDRPPKMMEKEMQETKVKALLGMGPGPEAEYTGPFGKIGEYFSKNAAARDKMFSMLGTMGRELVKPIEPGQEADWEKVQKNTQLNERRRQKLHLTWHRHGKKLVLCNIIPAKCRKPDWRFLKELILTARKGKDGLANT